MKRTPFKPPSDRPSRSSSLKGGDASKPRSSGLSRSSGLKDGSASKLRSSSPKGDSASKTRSSSPKGGSATKTRSSRPKDDSATRKKPSLSPWEQQKEAAKRSALNALKRARRSAEKAGVSLSDWEGEFLDSVDERIREHGRAFADPEKGAPGQALSSLQGRKLKEITAKAKGEETRPWMRKAKKAHE